MKKAKPKAKQNNAKSTAASKAKILPAPDNFPVIEVNRKNSTALMLDDDEDGSSSKKATDKFVMNFFGNINGMAEVGSNIPNALNSPGPDSKLKRARTEAAETSALRDETFR